MSPSVINRRKSVTFKEKILLQMDRVSIFIPGLLSQAGTDQGLAGGRWSQASIIIRHVCQMCVLQDTVHREHEWVPRGPDDFVGFAAKK